LFRFPLPQMMTDRIERAILRYLSFNLSPSEHDGILGQADKELWEQGLAFADTAGLSLFLRAELKQRGDFQGLPHSVQQGLEQRFQDNLVRTQDVSQEFIEFNRLLHAHDIQFLNLKGQMLYPDFVDKCENRLQYDHDFLVGTHDLQKSYDIFLNLGYSPLPSSPKLAVGHLPTLVKKTGWQWKGNLFDPAIPRAVELHFQLWDSEFDRIPIRTLDNVWRDSQLATFHTVWVPVLSREHRLLHCVLHAFRHLLRNDLRLSHLYEIAYFLHRRSKNDNFWPGFLNSLSCCRPSCRATAALFELACRIFGSEPQPIVSQFINQHLTPGADLWIEKYGLRESIHCYRRSKSALFLHLDFVEGLAGKGVVMRRKLIPRHLPLSSFGVPKSAKRQNGMVRGSNRFYDAGRLISRMFFHGATLADFVVQLPVWVAKLHRRRSGTQNFVNDIQTVVPAPRHKEPR
jgi:putative nucleotidyltransferase-like protein